MWALGDKIASSIVAQTAGVPTMPWSGSGTLNYITTACRMLHQGVLILYAGMRDTEEYEINAINRSYGKQFFFSGWVAHRTVLLLW